MEKDFIKRIFLFVLSGSVILGIFWGAYGSVSFVSLLFILALLICCVIYSWFREEKTFVFGLICIAVGFSLGFLRFVAVDQEIDSNLEIRNETSVTIVGTVARDPEDRLGRREYIIDDAVFFPDGEHVPGKILVRGDRVPKFYYGDVVEWNGTFGLPEAFLTDAGREFDYSEYLKKDGIVATLSFAQGGYIGEGEKSFIKNVLYNIKHVYIENIDMVVPVPESVLAAGLLLGERGSFGEDLTNDFRRAGLIHIVVLSGYNIAIISEYTLVVLRKKFRKKLSLILAGLFIVLFALLVGGGATVVRASIMGILVLLARGGSRRYNITRALVFAGLLMILHNPLILIYDVSFHLSVLATIALIYVAPLVERYVTKLPETFGVREAGIATIATQIFVLPYLIYRMGDVSLIAPVVNILVLPIIPLTMLFAFLVGLAGIVSSGVAYVLSFILTPLLSYTIFMTELFARLPFASITIPEISLFVMVLMYSVLVWSVWKLKQKPLVAEQQEVEAFEVIEYQIIRAE